MIPITILTGFLGSGKTTLINKIIKFVFTNQIHAPPMISTFVAYLFLAHGKDILEYYFLLRLHICVLWQQSLARTMGKRMVEGQAYL